MVATGSEEGLTNGADRIRGGADQWCRQDPRRGWSTRLWLKEIWLRNTSLCSNKDNSNASSKGFMNQFKRFVMRHFLLVPGALGRVVSPVQARPWPFGLVVPSAVVFAPDGTPYVGYKNGAIPLCL